jgi:hypothetical protein
MAAVVGITWRDGLAAMGGTVTFYRILPSRRQYGEVTAKIDRIEAVAGGDHFFMDFFTRADTHDRVFTFRTDSER